jgi:hypothetical protein
MNNIILIFLSFIVIIYVSLNLNYNNKENFLGFFNRSKDILFNPDDLKLDNIKIEPAISQSFNMSNIKHISSNTQPIPLNSIVNNKSIPLKNNQPVPSNSIENNQSVPSNNILENSCKFLDTDKCSNDYPIYTGASLGSIGDNNLLCESTIVNNIFRPAKLIASISNGSINNIYIVDSGNNYKDIPKLIVKGDGDGAELKAELIDNKISKVNIINNGFNYKNTPFINIDNPINNNKCYLCCKSK